MKYLINYAHNKFLGAQKKQTETAYSIGRFDKVFEYGITDIDKEFYEKNKFILDQPTGAGYWLWKPYLILKQLKQLKSNDFLFYLDSGAYFTGAIDPLVKVAFEHTLGILAFYLDSKLTPVRQRIQTKMDAWILMKANNDHYYNGFCTHAGINGWRNTKEAIEFLTQWLEYAQVPEIITDSPSTLGAELSEYKFHRHDQSIFSVLCTRFNIPSFTDPSQLGNKDRDEQSIHIPHIIYHHRNANLQ
jgi:hypothetical protein